MRYIYFMQELDSTDRKQKRRIRKLEHLMALWQPPSELKLPVPVDPDEVSLATYKKIRARRGCAYPIEGWHVC